MGLLDLPAAGGRLTAAAGDRGPADAGPPMRSGQGQKGNLPPPGPSPSVVPYIGTPTALFRRRAVFRAFFRAGRFADLPAFFFPAFFFAAFLAFFAMRSPCRRRPHTSAGVP